MLRVMGYSGEAGGVGGGGGGNNQGAAADPPVRGPAESNEFCSSTGHH